MPRIRSPYPPELRTEAIKVARSSRGSQYTSTSFSQKLEEARVVPSMGSGAVLTTMPRKTVWTRRPSVAGRVRRMSIPEFDSLLSAP